MLTLLSKHINKNHIGLYRDDGLVIVKNTSSPEAEKIKKKIQKLFKEKDLPRYNIQLKRCFMLLSQKTRRRIQLYSHHFRPSAINH